MGGIVLICAKVAWSVRSMGILPRRESLNGMFLGNPQVRGMQSLAYAATLSRSTYFRSCKSPSILTLWIAGLAGLLDTWYTKQVLVGNAEDHEKEKSAGSLTWKVPRWYAVSMPNFRA